MIRSKTYKIILLLTAFVMTILAAVCSMASVNVNADDATANKVDATASSYFKGGQSLEFKDDALVATVKNGDEVEIKNELMINDFEMAIAIGENIEKVTLKLVTDSYYVNGNLVEKELVKEVENECVVSGDKVAISVDGGVLKVNGEDLAQKVKPVGAVGAEISFAFELKEGAEIAEFEIKSIDQNADVDGYKQTFEVKDGKLTAALPRVALNDEVYSRNYANEPVFIVNKEESLSFNVYSVLGDVKASDISVESDSEGAKVAEENSKWILFGTAGVKEVKLVAKEKVLETISVTAVTYGTDTDVPTYINNEDAINAFDFAVKNTTADLYPGATFNIPSLEDLVSDNTIPYSKLEKTVYYRTPTTSSTSTSMSFKLDRAGSYTFFVAFGDGANKMAEEDFMEVDGDVVTYGKYEAFIFSFDVSESIPSIDAPEDGVAYRGVTYTSASFKIDADGFKTEYKLFYNANKDAKAEDDGWEEIPKASTVKEGDENYDAYKSINYDGKLTFKPIKIGAYKIVCSASSEYTTNREEASTIIKVENEPKTVKIPSTWLQDNVWSVVFLSIGTLCLIGIIVLLCIKPKEETDEE